MCPVILRCQSTFYDQWFKIYRIGDFWPFLTLFGQKRALSMVWWIYIIWSTNKKLRLPVILRGQPTFYDQWFRRYRIGDFWPFWHFFLKNGHFRFSDGYTLYQTLIEKLSFRLKWGVYHVHKTSGSGDIVVWWTVILHV